MSEPVFGRVSVIGLGLMGGSLARSLSSLREAPEVVGYSPDPEERRAAVASGAVNIAAASAAEAASGAGLVVYATPLGATLELLEGHRELWAEDAAVTDVVSLKEPVVERIRQLGVADRYVGSHPMVGGEVSGFGASREGLYEGAPVWLASGTGSRELRSRIDRFWTSLGARSAWIDASEHDRLMVRASHLPQLVANALAEALLRSGLSKDQLGPGGRDMARLAGSSPEMWRDLLEVTAPDLAAALREVIDALSDTARLLDVGDIDGVSRIMSRTRAWASRSVGDDSPKGRRGG